ncbi:hypothetical protein CFOL_v3_29520, partial [Cephalotus follicularis]
MSTMPDDCDFLPAGIEQAKDEAAKAQKKAEELVSSKARPSDLSLLEDAEEVREEAHISDCDVRTANTHGGENVEDEANVIGGPCVEVAKDDSLVSINVDSCW